MCRREVWLRSSMTILLLNNMAPAALKSSLPFPMEVLQTVTAEPEHKKREFL